MPPGVRVYAIGDIHGCSSLLERLHDAIADDRSRNPVSETVIVYLGDYIDRGPNSAGVLDILSGPAPEGISRVFLMGNHEDMLLEFLDNPERGTAWRSFGGNEMMLSYRIDIRGALDQGGYTRLRDEFVARVPGTHVSFLRSLRPSYSLGDYFFCHAGVRPGVPLEQQSPKDLMWIREAFLSSAHDHGKLIVHGHTPVEEPDVRPNRIGVDTGAYATGRLTAVVLEGDERRFLSTASK